MTLSINKITENIYEVCIDDQTLILDNPSRKELSWIKNIESMIKNIFIEKTNIKNEF